MDSNLTQIECLSDHIHMDGWLSLIHIQGIGEEGRGVFGGGRVPV